ncbi:MAG: PorT family protein [Treponema sp.]|nr:PorT family protein [Treponema sp.]
MKKLITLLAVSVTAIAVAAADPLIVLHGFVNLNAFGSTLENNSEDFSALGAFGDNVSAGGGVGVNIPFGGYFGVQPGVDFYFNRVAFKDKDSDLIGAYNYVSLDVPVLFTAKLEKWNFALGPYVSIPLGDLNRTRKEGGSGINGSLDISTGANIGMLFGVGYEERLGLGRIVFGARYMLDFMPIETKVGSTTHKDFTRRGLIIDIGYKVPLTFFGG